MTIYDIYRYTFLYSVMFTVRTIKELDYNQSIKSFLLMLFGLDMQTLLLIINLITLLMTFQKS